MVGQVAQILRIDNLFNINKILSSVSNRRKLRGENEGLDRPAQERIYKMLSYNRLAGV